MLDVVRKESEGCDCLQVWLDNGDYGDGDDSNGDDSDGVADDGEEGVDLVLIILNISCVLRSIIANFMIKTVVMLIVTVIVIMISVIIIVDKKFSGVPACPLTGRRHRIWHGHSSYIQGLNCQYYLLSSMTLVLHHQYSTDSGGISGPHHEHLQCNSVTEGISNACRLPTLLYAMSSVL